MVNINSIDDLKSIAFGGLTKDLALHKIDWHHFHNNLRTFAEELVNSKIEKVSIINKAQIWISNNIYGLSNFGRDISTISNKDIEIADNLKYLYDIQFKYALVFVPDVFSPYQNVRNNATPKLEIMNQINFGVVLIGINILIIGLNYIILLSLIGIKIIKCLEL